MHGMPFAAQGKHTAGGGTALLSQNENCLKCHPAQRGPYVFEHEAMQEGCTTCHTAHGSVNAKMLTVRDSNLCLKCHFQQQARTAEPSSHRRVRSHHAPATGHLLVGRMP